MEKNQEQHREWHQLLHEHLDEVIADFFRHTQATPSKTTIKELIDWSYAQTKNPTPTADASY